jgi:hypothetical protein
MEMLKQEEIKMTQESQTNVMMMEDNQDQRTAFRGLEAKNLHAWFGKHHHIVTRATTIRRSSCCGIAST